VAGSDQVDQAEYDNDTTNWLIGQVRTRTSTSCTRPDNKCQTQKSSYDFYPNGNLKERVVEPDDDVVEPDDDDVLLRTTIAYGTFGNVSSITDADSTGEVRTTTFTFDDLGLYPKTTTNALNQSASVNVHPGLGVVLDSHDANGVIPATMKYDRYGRLREVDRADGYFERYTTSGPLDHLEHLTTIPDGDGGTVAHDKVTLDLLGRPISRTLFDEHDSTVFTAYDRFGRLRSESRPTAAGETALYTTMAYDNRDRLLATVDPDQVVNRHEYIGLETHTYDGNNVHSYVLERPDGRIGSRFEDDPKSMAWLQTKFDYGPFGRLRKTTAADNTSQTMEYDRHGRLTVHTDPSTGTTTSKYNAFDELRHQTNGNGETTDIQIHDVLGRPTRINSPDGLTTYSWDKPRAIGQLDVSTQNDPNGHYVVTHFTYDDIGRNYRTSWDVDNDAFFELEVGFDEIGRLESITYPRIPFDPEAPEVLSPPRLKVNYAYSPIGYLNSVSDSATGTPYWRADTRAPDGQVTQETYANGVVGTRDYQPETGLLQTLTIDGPTEELDEIAYGYDDNRNVILRNDMVGAGARSQTYAYDSLNRLISWSHGLTADASDLVTTIFDYNSIGSLSKETVTGRTGRNVTYQHGQNGASPHAVTMRNGQSYMYDGAGRRISGGGLTSISYNRRNLPLQVRRSSGGISEFAYDAAGTRVLKRTSDYTRFSFAGLFERTIANRTRNQHYIVAEGREVAQVTLTQDVPTGPIVDTEIRYLHTDGQGSTTLVTNENGTRVADLFYDPFGRRTDSMYDPLTGMVPARPGYTGHRDDDELGLIDMKGRIYDHETRRFLTPDPFIQAPLLSQNHNRYSYVWNNPATLIDPTGFFGDGDPDYEVCYPGPCPDTGSTEGGGFPVEVGIGVAIGAAIDTAITAATVWGICSLLGCGGDSGTPPSTDDNDPTDNVTTGASGSPHVGVGPGGGAWVEPQVSIWKQITADLNIPPTPPWTMPEWVAGLEHAISGYGRYAGWSHGPAGVAAWSNVVDSTVAGSVVFDEFIGSLPIVGEIYYGAQGRWQEASNAAIVDGLTFGIGELAAGGASGIRMGLGLGKVPGRQGYRAWSALRGFKTWDEIAPRMYGGDLPRVESAMRTANELHFNMEGFRSPRAPQLRTKFGEPVNGYSNFEYSLMRTQYPEKSFFWIGDSEFIGPHRF